ncbi:glycosyltransferase family A protein [Aquimarina rubra]|uniref:Glycosyltransferase family A protein n=1 Tax=Aquimarina rubra TaxID=1920033 RepID=A0ABW5LIJ2_9FLAO
MNLPKDNQEVSVDFEILISTMFRTTLQFLEDMFEKRDDYKNYNILIVNQTDRNKILVSSLQNIRVINSFERGTTKSRNLALKNAIGNVCLMADDDTKYVSNIKNIIIESHQKYPDMGFISFEAVDEQLNPFTVYPKTGLHSKKTLQSIYTLVITFKRTKILEANVLYNEYFGLNTIFNTGEEYVFLRGAYDKGVKIFHVPIVIVSHPKETSGKLQGNDDIIFSRSAVKYRYTGFFTYLWLVKYIFFLVRKKYISVREVPHKFLQGIKGIQKYKELKASDKI